MLPLLFIMQAVDGVPAGQHDTRVRGLLCETRGAAGAPHPLPLSLPAARECDWPARPRARHRQMCVSACGFGSLVCAQCRHHAHLRPILCPAASHTFGPSGVDRGFPELMRLTQWRHYAVPVASGISELPIEVYLQEDQETGIP